MKRLILAAVSFALILLAAPHAPAAETFPARVVGVVDGDMLKVSSREGGTVMVGLFRTCCPKKGQNYGS